VSPIFLIVTPLAGKIMDARNSRFSFVASRRSMWALLALGLIVAVFFAYLYWHEWWLERGFRRYRVSTARDQEGTGPATLAIPRKPLVATTKPAALTPGSAPPDAKQKSNHHPPASVPTSTQTRVNWNTHAPETILKPARGLVIVQAEDPFHEIYVDDSFVGNAPARLNLLEGAHWIEIRKVGCNPYRRELQVIAGTEVSLRTVLEKLDSQPQRSMVPAEGVQRSG
jgi:hypothetical protein